MATVHPFAAEPLTRAIFATRRRRFVATVATGHHRLSDVLNQPLSSYLALQEVQLVAPDDPLLAELASGARGPQERAGPPDESAWEGTARAQQFPVGMLRKTEVQYVVIVAEPERPLGQTMR